MTGVIQEVGEEPWRHYMVYIDRESPEPGMRVTKAEAARLRRWCKKNAPSLIHGHGIVATTRLPAPELFPENARPGVHYYGAPVTGQFWLIRVKEYMDAFNLLMWKG